MAESALEKRCVFYAKSTGWLVRKVVYPGRRGAPDRWHLKKGLWVLIEMKDLGERPTEIQLREHARLRAAGALVYVVDNFDQYKEILDSHARTLSPP